MDPFERVFADRIGGKSFLTQNAGYKFTLIERKKSEFRDKNPELPIIDLGLGEPERPSPGNVIDRLCREARISENRVYPLKGPADFREAASRYLARTIGVSLDPTQEVLMSIGAKQALSLIPFAFLNSGDTVLVTSPGYPVLPTVAEWLGAKVVSIGLRRKDGYVPPISLLEELVTQHRPKLVLFNYPNNPTGAVASHAFYESVVELAHRHFFVLVQDAPYCDYCFESSYASPLQVAGGKEVTLEVYSLSKSFNLQGFRLGFVAGSKDLVRAFGLIRDNTDSGQYIPLQKAAVEAFETGSSFTEENKKRYRTRQQEIVSILNRNGIEATLPPGGVYVFCVAPQDFRGRKFASAMGFCEYLIEQFGIITVPWETDDGPFLRLSMTFESDGGGWDGDQHVYRELASRLSQCLTA